MGLTINGKAVQPTEDYMTEAGLATTTEVAELLRMHPYRASAVIGLAYVRNRWQKNSSPKLFSLKRVAELLSDANGFTIGAHHLHELIKRVEGQEIMLAHGVPRSRCSWRYWASLGVGPRPIKVGGTYRYLRTEVKAWAKYMAATPEFHYLKAAEKANSPCDLVPMPPIFSAPGDEGGTLQFSCTESGVE